MHLVCYLGNLVHAGKAADFFFDARSAVLRKPGFPWDFFAHGADERIPPRAEALVAGLELAYGGTAGLLCFECRRAPAGLQHK